MNHPRRCAPTSGQLCPGLGGNLPLEWVADLSGIRNTAFIFDQNRFTVDPATVFSHFVMRRTGTRDITQATFRANTGHELIALCNHWPSRSGGVVESAGFRATAGETLSYWHERIREVRGADSPIIALGDFNDDPFDDSIPFVTMPKPGESEVMSNGLGQPSSITSPGITFASRWSIIVATHASSRARSITAMTGMSLISSWPTDPFSSASAG